MGDLAEVGAALRLLRERARMSQDQLAKAAGIGGAQVSRYERGFRAPQLGTLDALLTGLGASLHDLADALDQVNGRTNRVSESVIAERLPGYSATVYRTLADILERMEVLERATETSRRKASPSDGS